MRGKSKAIILVIIIIAFLFTTSLSFADSSVVGVVLDDVRMSYNSSSGYPFIDLNNRTQVPLRATMEAFGCIVKWDDTNKTSTVEKEGVTVVVPIGKDYVYINNTIVQNDTVAQIKSSRTYLPIRIVLEAFGAYVEWKNEEKVVWVASKEKIQRDTRSYAGQFIIEFQKKLNDLEKSYAEEEAECKSFVDKLIVERNAEVKKRSALIMEYEAKLADYGALQYKEYTEYLALVSGRGVNIISPTAYANSHSKYVDIILKLKDAVETLEDEIASINTFYNGLIDECYVDLDSLTKSYLELKKAILGEIEYYKLMQERE